MIRCPNCKNPISLDHKFRLNQQQVYHMECQPLEAGKTEATEGKTHAG